MSIDQFRSDADPEVGMAIVDTCTIDTRCVGDVAVVHIEGVVDMTTVPTVKAKLMRAVMGEMTAVVVDMTNVGFLACAGLQMLVETRDMARACQVGLRFAVRSRAVLRPMEITGLLEGFLVHRSVSSALAALAPLPPPRAGADQAGLNAGEPAQRVDHARVGHLCLAIAEDHAEVGQDKVGAPEVDGREAITRAVAGSMMIPPAIAGPSAIPIFP
jgi:anti-sigma B factor antagonist